MTTNHIDQLTQWWETAEQDAPNPGDTIIINLGGGGYSVETASENWGYWGRDDDTRILARTPKPTPAWHDAVAVIAKGQDEWDRREAFTRSDDYPETRWVCNQGVTFKSEDLFDVTPLIEQKVTDEMVGRIRELEDGYGRKYFASPHAALALLHAALGLDPA